jgi:AcrR family transcriptional regulator
MSLYRYVASKDELLDAMIDKIYEEIELPPEETDGQSAMRRRAVFAYLRKSGFSILMATRANWLLDSYVYGFALQEPSLPFDTADALSDMITVVYLPQLLPEEFPYLNASAA